MYRPVGHTRRDHAKDLLRRAGYAEGGDVAIEGGDEGIVPDGIPDEGPNATSGPAPFAKPRRLGRRHLKKLRP